MFFICVRQHAIMTTKYNNMCGRDLLGPDFKSLGKNPVEGKVGNIDGGYYAHCLEPDQAGPWKPVTAENVATWGNATTFEFCCTMERFLHILPPFRVF